MSTKNGPLFLTIVTEDDLEALCYEAYCAFEEAFEASDLGEEDAFLLLGSEGKNPSDSPERVEAMITAWKALQRAFALKTPLPNGEHLELVCGYYDVGGYPEIDDDENDTEGISGYYFAFPGLQPEIETGKSFLDVFLSAG